MQDRVIESAFCVFHQDLSLKTLEKVHPTNEDQITPLLYAVCLRPAHAAEAIASADVDRSQPRGLVPVPTGIINCRIVLFAVEKELYFKSSSSMHSHKSREP